MDTSSHLRNRNVDDQQWEQIQKELIEFWKDVEGSSFQRESAIAEGTATAVAEHKNSLYQQRVQFQNIRSTTTCLGCLARRPEHTL